MARLPQPGGDTGNWGDILNDYLTQSHKSDGTIKDNVITSNALAPNSVTSNALATNSVNAATIADGSITETLLAPAVQTKLNAASAPAATIADGSITKAKLETSVQTSLGKADTALHASDIAGKADDTAVLHKATTETVTGAKNFTGGLTINGTGVVVTNDARLADQRTPLDNSVATIKLQDTAVTKAKLETVVQTSLGKADTAAQPADVAAKYTKPATGIPLTDIKRADLDAIYIRTVNGATPDDTGNVTVSAGSNIPADGSVTTVKLADDNVTSAKLAPAIRTSLGKADTALQTAPVASVAGKTGTVTLAKGDVALGNVDNTSDINKPVSTAQQTALDAKAPTARAISTTGGLTGGGTLANDLSLGITYGTAANTVAQGNDVRLSDTRVPTDGSVTTAKIADGAITSAKIADGSITSAKLAAAVGATRSAAFCFEMCQTSVSFNANQGFHNRRPFRLGVKPTRFRVRFRNRNQLGDANVAGAIGQIQNLTVVIGKPAVDSTTGDPNGNWLATPTSVMASTTIAAGVEAVSPWIDAATYSVDTDIQHMLGYSFLSANVANGQVAYSGGLSFQDQTPSNLTVLAPSTPLTRANNSAFLQVIVEYEHTDVGAKHLLIVGNSLSGPSAASGVDNYGEIGTYHQIWAITNRSAASSIAVAGSYAAHYASGNTRWDIFDGFNIPYVPDMVLYFGAPSSDLAGGPGDTATSNAVKTNVQNMIKKGRSKYPTARQVLTNIPPRIAFTGGASGTNEYERINTINPYLHMLPVQTEQCIDIDSLVTDWASPARIRTVMTTDTTHFNRRAHDLISQTIPLKRD